MLIPRWLDAVVGCLLLFATTAVESQMPTQDQRDLGVCAALRPALDGAGPNAGPVNAAAARAALANCEPGTVPTIIGTVMVLIAEGNTAALRAEANRAAAIAPDDPYVLRMQCHAEINLRNSARAVELCTRALALRPDWDQALHYRAVALNNLGRSAEAIADYERALARNPRLPLTLTNLFLVYRSTGNRDKAAGALSRALALTPNDAPRLFSMTELLSAMGRYAEAESLADRLVARRGSAADLNLRGHVRMELGKSDAALTDFVAAEAADPRWAAPVFNQGVAHQRKSGLCGAALPYYVRAARMDTTYVEPVWAQIRCNVVNARLLDELTRRDSMNAMAWYRRARFRSDSTRAQRDSSIRDLNRALALDSALAGGHVARAELHGANGDHARAVPDFRAALARAQEGTLGLIAANLTTALVLSGQSSEAIATLGELDARFRNTAVDNRVFIGLRGMVRLRTGDVGGVRDVAEWVHDEEVVIDTALFSGLNAWSAHQEARTGGISRDRFESALSELMRDSRLADAARYMRMAMRADANDRRGASEDLRALKSAPVHVRGHVAMALYLVLDVGAERMSVGYSDPRRDRGMSACTKVFAIYPDGEVRVGSGDPGREPGNEARIWNYDLSTRRLDLMDKAGQEIAVDLSDSARPVIQWPSGTKVSLRRCVYQSDPS